MDTAQKQWWKSKTVWSGILAIAFAGYTEAAGQFGLPPVPEFVFAVLGVLGIYGRVTATKPLGK
jgi:hypothetical protein